MNDGETLEYIVRESQSYEMNIIDLETTARNYLDYHNQEELRKWEYLSKIPKGLFGR